MVGDQKIHDLGYHFLLMPILLNVAILLGVTLIVNYFIPGRRYPANMNRPGKADAHAGDSQSPVKLSFEKEDLIAALREMDGYIDVSKEDLARIYGLATVHAHQRAFGGTSMNDIMTHDVVSVHKEADFQSVWALMTKHRIRGVPVTDPAGKLIGMVTIADFLKALDWRVHESLAQRFNY